MRGELGRLQSKMVIQISPITKSELHSASQTELEGMCSELVTIDLEEGAQ